jgi:uncharacterized RDD family membrane protein YckC
MICAACGFKHIETGDHRCPRCGRRLDRPAPDRRGDALPPMPPPPILAPARGQAATAAAPQWKQEVTERFEQFQQKRAHRLGSPLWEPLEEDKSEQVPHPDPNQKIIAFEDFAADRIQPLIIETPRSASPGSGAARSGWKPSAPSRERAAPDGNEQAQPASSAQATPPPAARPEEARREDPWREENFSREILCPNPVAPLPLRVLAVALDLAVATVAAGAFLGTFHLLGGAIPLNQKAGGAMTLAAALLLAFYFLVYIVYGAETPGLQWMGLCVLNYEGLPPNAGQRLVRAAGMLLSGAALGLGYLWALADEEALTWHDRMSKTFVARDDTARQRFQPRPS